jgi:hypothetical protein
MMVKKWVETFMLILIYGKEFFSVSICWFVTITLIFLNGRVLSVYKSIPLLLPMGKHAIRASGEMQSFDFHSKWHKQ